MAGFDNDVCYGANIDFSGGDPVSGKMLQDGQLLIGSTALNAGGTHCNIGFITSLGGTLTITNKPGSVNIETAGGLAPVEHLTGNTGGQLSPILNNFNILTANATPKFAGLGATLTQDFNLTNLCLGSSMPALTSGNTNVGVGSGVLAALTSGISNVAIGYQAGASLTGCTVNTLVGYQAGNKMTTGSGNVAVGKQSLFSFTTGAASTGGNTAIGTSALVNLLTGRDNIAIGGSSPGQLLTGSESSNILIAHNGVAAESNAMRLGTTGSGNGNINATYIAGVAGVTVANQTLVVQNSSSEQLGVIATANDGVLISSNTGVPSWLANGTAGQVLTANTGAAPSWQSGSFTSIVRQVFTSTGTYTPTAGMLYCDIEVVGGGGGGGAGQTSVGVASAGGGGGGGGYARGIFSAATIGGSQSVTVGASGSGGAAGNNNGVQGGTTSVGSLISATGGFGGVVGVLIGIGIGGDGGAGGVGSNGNFQTTGSPGLFGFNPGTLSVCGGGGGNSYFGGGAPQVRGTSAGGNGTSYGGGGSGAAIKNGDSQLAGGNGSKGVVIITEYI